MKSLSYVPLVVLLFFLLPLHYTHGARATATSTHERYAIAVPILFGITHEALTPNFGEPRGGGTRTHEGLDLMTDEGAPIVSPVKATVIAYGTAPTPGKYVYTKGSDGHMYWYMHLDEIAKLKRGQKLKPGDLIGTVGETGNAKGTTPHLHFEIRKGKTIIDPYLRIQKTLPLKDQVAYLNASIRQIKKKDEYIARVVELYGSRLIAAQKEGLVLNKDIERVLTRYTSSLGKDALGLKLGDTDAQVYRLQLALIKRSAGPEAEALALHGGTGYFGPLTERALTEYQVLAGLPATGIIDTPTLAHINGI